MAAAVVYFHHLAPPAGAPSFVLTARKAGYWGVTLFFLLSGFVLALNHFDSMAKPTAAKVWSFASARIARVYPLYFVLLMYWTCLGGGIAPKTTVWIEHLFAVQAWLPNMRQAFELNGPAWSVGVELFLYATFPLLIPLLARVDRSLRSLLVAAAIIAGVLAAVTLWFQLTGRGSLPVSDPRGAHRWLYRFPAARLGDFALGILAARIFVRVRTFEGIERLGRWLTIAGLLAVVVLTTTQAFVYATWSWDAGYVLPAIALVLGLSLAPSTLAARFLSSRMMVRFGEASYAFYLVHWACLKLTGTAWSAHTTSITVATVLFQMAGVLALSVGLHELVEKPAQVWVRGLANAVAKARWPMPAQPTRGASVAP